MTYSTVDIATKQRHLALLQKVKNAEALSAAELAELERYEAESKAPPRPSFIVHRPSSKRNLSEAQAQRLGCSCKDIAEADAASGLGPNLARYFERHPRIRAAFDRGRLLRYLVELAPKAMIYEAARRLKDLGFVQFDSPESLRVFLDGDAEANELWETARVNGWIGNREALRKTAGEGNVKAIQLMDKWAVDRQRETGESGGVSFTRVGVNQMAELFGVTRTTIWEWYKDRGLPQNVDGTFDLARAISWFEEFTLKKAVRGKDAVGSLNAFQDVKVKHMLMKLEQEQGELANRGEILGWQIAEMQNIVNEFKDVSHLANNLHDQSREQIVQRLDVFGDKLMATLENVPAELKLSTEAEGKLIELYEILKPQKTEDRRQDTETKKAIEDTACGQAENTEKASHHED